MKKLDFHFIPAGGVTPFIKLMSILLLVLLCVQGAVLCYFNFFTLESHMGYDSSWAYLKAQLMWQERSLIHGPWKDTTCSNLDAPSTLASLFYGMGMSIYTAQGLANTLVLGALMLSLNSVMKLLGQSVLARLSALNLLLCPLLGGGFYVNNDLGYFSCILSGASYYAVRMVCCVLIVRTFLCLRQGKKDWIGLGASLLLCAFCAFSSGFYVAVVTLLPLCLYELIEVFRTNTLQGKGRELLYLALVFVMMVAGKFLSGKVGLTTVESNMSWISIEELPKNITSVPLGMAKLIGLLPQLAVARILIFSRPGISQIVFLSLGVGMVLLGIMAVKPLDKEREPRRENTSLLLCLLSGNWLIFSLYLSTYASPIFEERYLIFAYLVLILLAGEGVSTLERSDLRTKITLLTLFTVLLGANLISDRHYLINDNSTWGMEPIASTLADTNADLVYYFGEMDCQGRALRVIDEKRIYRFISNDGHCSFWGDYLYYSNPGDYNGETALLLPHGKPMTLPQEVMEQFTLYRSLETVDIYLSDHNPLTQIQ